VAAALVALPGSALGQGVELAGAYLIRGYADHNRFDPFLSFLPKNLNTDLPGEPPAYSYSLVLWASERLAASLEDQSLVLAVDTGVDSIELGDVAEGQDRLSVDGLAPDEALESLVFLREAYLEWGFGSGHPLVATAGKKRTVLMDGYFYDDHGFRLGADWDFAEFGAWTATASATALLPQHYFPDADTDLALLHGSLAITDSIDSVTVGAIFLSDRQDVLAGMLRDVLAEDLAANEKPIMSMKASSLDVTGDLGLRTLYASGAVTLGPATFRALLAFQGGGGTLTWTGEKPTGRTGGSKQEQSVERETDIGGRLLSTEVQLDVAGSVSLTPFFLGASGTSLSEAKDEGRFDQFLTLVPCVERLRLFFGTNGTMLATREYRLLGLGSGGVNAFGLQAGWAPTADISLSEAVAALGPARPDDSPFTKEYGVESDFTLLYSVSSVLGVRIEIDALFPGGYFADDDPMVRGVAGVEGTF